MSLFSQSLQKSFMIHVRSKDTEQLTSGFNSDMKVNLDAPIRRNNALQDLHLSLSTAHIPFTFYQFSSNLENLNIYVDGSPSYVLSEGNYDIYEIIADITANVTFPYSASYNQNSNKITLTNTDATQHTLNFSGLESKGLGKNLGFSDTDIVIASGGSATSDGTVNLQTIHTIYLHSDLALSNVITTETNNYINIIDQINVDVQPFEIISHGFYESAPFASVLNQEQIKTFQLSIRDQNNRLIQMNNANFELSILVEIHNEQIQEQISTARRSELLEPPQRGRRSIENITPLPAPQLAPQPAPTIPAPAPQPFIPQQFTTPSYTTENVRNAGTFSGFQPPPAEIQMPKETNDIYEPSGELLDALLMAKKISLE